MISADCPQGQSRWRGASLQQVYTQPQPLQMTFRFWPAVGLPTIASWASTKTTSGSRSGIKSQTFHIKCCNNLRYSLFALPFGADSCAIRDPVKIGNTRLHSSLFTTLEKRTSRKHASEVQSLHTLHQRTLCGLTWLMPTVLTTADCSLAGADAPVEVRLASILTSCHHVPLAHDVGKL